jgi:hypothetical protein
VKNPLWFSCYHPTSTQTHFWRHRCLSPSSVLEDVTLQKYSWQGNRAGCSRLRGLPGGWACTPQSSPQHPAWGGGLWGALGSLPVDCLCSSHLPKSGKKGKSKVSIRENPGAAMERKECLLWVACMVQSRCKSSWTGQTPGVDKQASEGQRGALTFYVNHWESVPLALDHHP